MPTHNLHTKLSEAFLKKFSEAERIKATENGPKRIATSGKAGSKGAVADRRTKEREEPLAAY